MVYEPLRQGVRQTSVIVPIFLTELTAVSANESLHYSSSRLDKTDVCCCCLRTECFSYCDSSRRPRRISRLIARPTRFSQAVASQFRSRTLFADSSSFPVARRHYRRYFCQSLQLWVQMIVCDNMFFVHRAPCRDTPIRRIASGLVPTASVLTCVWPSGTYSWDHASWCFSTLRLDGVPKHLPFAPRCSATFLKKPSGKWLEKPYSGSGIRVRVNLNVNVIQKASCNFWVQIK